MCAWHNKPAHQNSVNFLMMFILCKLKFCAKTRVVRPAASVLALLVFVHQESINCAVTLLFCTTTTNRRWYPENCLINCPAEARSVLATLPRARAFQAHLAYFSIASSSSLLYTFFSFFYIKTSIFSRIARFATTKKEGHQLWSADFRAPGNTTVWTPFALLCFFISPTVKKFLGNTYFC